MTGSRTREAISGKEFDDGITLKASAFCDQLGIEFTFNTFRDRDGMPFARNGDLIYLRLRIDNRAVETIQAKVEHTNQAQLLFYDAAAAEKALRKAMPQMQNKDAQNAYAFMMTKMMLQQVEANAAGRLADLVGARSIRVELPVANGSAYVVDLNPQDTALRNVAQQCSASAPALESHLPVAGDKCAVTVSHYDTPNHVDWNGQIDLRDAHETGRIKDDGQVEVALPDGGTFYLAKAALRTAQAACRLSALHQLIVNCASVIGTNDITHQIDAIRPGTYPINAADIGPQSGESWYHITDGAGHWIKAQACVVPKP